MRILVHIIILSAAACAVLQPAHVRGQQVRTGDAATPPRLLDPEAAEQALTQRYPAAYERTNSGGSVRLRAFVNVAGRVDTVRVVSSTGHARMDAAARNVVRSARFVPARGADGPVSAWVEVSLRFGDPPAHTAEQEPLRLVEREAWLAAAQSRNPRSLRRSGIDVDVPVHVTVDASGRVVHRETPVPGCHPSATSAALALANDLRFEARGNSDGTLYHTALTVTFGDSVSVLLRGDEEAPLPPRDTTRAASGSPARGGASTFERPELRNEPQVRDALVRNYPPAMAEAGLGGRVTVWIFVDEKGNPARRRIADPSGRCDLDRAALEVARIMRFTPGRLDGEPTGVWVEIPVHFGVR